MPALRSRVLHRDALSVVHEVGCDGGPSGSVDVDVAPGDVLVLPAAGLYAWGTGRDTWHPADALSGMFLRGGDAYRVRHPLGGGDVSLAIGAAPSTIDEILGRDRATRPWSLPDPAQLLAVRLRWALVAGVADPLAVGEAVMALLATHHRSRRVAERGAAARTRRATVVARARERLHEQLDARLALPELAAAAGVSAFHLCRLFRAETGRSIHRYRLRLRLAAAIERLAAGAPDVTTVALDLGFADQSHLGRAVRRELATTPAALRRPASRSELRGLAGGLRAGSF